MNIADAIPASRELHLGVEGFWAHDEVTPSRESDGRRLADATKIGFPLQIVILLIGSIVATTVSVTGVFWLTTASIRTDIAVIRQAQADQLKIEEMKTKLEEANQKLVQQAVESLKAEVASVKGQVQLANIEITNVRREMNERKK